MAAPFDIIFPFRAVWKANLQEIPRGKVGKRVRYNGVMLQDYEVVVTAGASFPQLVVGTEAIVYCGLPPSELVVFIEY